MGTGLPIDGAVAGGTDGSEPRKAGAVRRLAGRLAILGQPSIALPLVLLASFVARGAWLDVPPGTLIFDEAYYVNAARVLSGIPVEADAAYADATLGLDPNREHPPLGKLLIAGSMAIFGDNGLGWRLPSVLAGMLALAAIYGIVRASGETARFAVAAVGVLALDNLMLVHSRIGTLDMLAIAPTLVGAWLALRGRWAAAGAMIAVGALVKISALFAVGALLGLLIWRAVPAIRVDRRSASAVVRPALAMTAAFAITGLGGLWLLDARFTSFASPVDHLRHIVSYGASLTAPIERSGICNSASSAPWQWPFNECPINYLRVDRTTAVGDRTVSTAIVDVRGSLNPVLAGAIPLALLFTGWLAWTRRSALAAWATLWALANWLPYAVLAFVNHRVTYLFYFLPVVPAIAVAAALLIRRAGLPRPVQLGMVVALVLGFVALFPFRELP